MKNLVAHSFMALTLFALTGCPEKTPEDNVSPGPKTATSAGAATPPPPANPPTNRGGW
jgi:hypothetical protein